MKRFVDEAGFPPKRSDREVATQAQATACTAEALSHWLSPTATRRRELASTISSSATGRFGFQHGAPACSSPVAIVAQAAAKPLAPHRMKGVRAKKAAEAAALAAEGEPIHIAPPKESRSGPPRPGPPVGQRCFRIPEVAFLCLVAHIRTSALLDAAVADVLEAAAGLDSTGQGLGLFAGEVAVCRGTEDESKKSRAKVGGFSGEVDELPELDIAETHSEVPEPGGAEGGEEPSDVPLSPKQNKLRTDLERRGSWTLCRGRLRGGGLRRSARGLAGSRACRGDKPPHLRRPTRRAWRRGWTCGSPLRWARRPKPPSAQRSSRKLRPSRR